MSSVCVRGGGAPEVGACYWAKKKECVRAGTEIELRYLKEIFTQKRKLQTIYHLQGFDSDKNQFSFIIRGLNINTINKIKLQLISMGTQL